MSSPRAIFFLPAFVLFSCVRATSTPLPAPDAGAPASLALVSLAASRTLADCTVQVPAATPCRITVAPPVREIDRRLGAGSVAAWGAADTLNVAFRASTDSVSDVEAGGGLQLPMSRIAGTSLWILSLRIPGADSGVVRLEVYETTGRAMRVDTSVREWRGPRAPERPRRAVALAGTQRVDSLWSDALHAWRRVTVYLPPGHGRERIPVVYFTDGQNVKDFARLVDPLIVSGALPPVALVGVWVTYGSPRGGPPTGPSDDLRTIEYLGGSTSLPGADSAFVAARYQGAKLFFTEEVRRWAEDSLHVSTDRRWRAVQGSSSGALYALLLGRERTDLYGLVIANSTGPRDAFLGPAAGWSTAPPHYLSAGVLEAAPARALRGIGDSLSAHGVPNVVNIYPSGHDYTVWTEELPRALRWWLQQRR
ncbi:MAG: hypothetical protein JWM95_2796 [Gemmatimonadetes bacterium]|nr:hypothetical protein [Gemmatimonadota bacterium]